MTANTLIPHRENPRDILGLDPHGAHLDRIDYRKYGWREIAFGMAPFDWHRGYDVEVDLGEILSLPGFKLPVKDQGQSGSCGGQAEANGGAVLDADQKKVFEEKSAKFVYSQVYAPGGGSYGGDLSRIAKNQGYAPERLCPSYMGGNTPPNTSPTEKFMERMQDITDDARHAAKSSRERSYADIAISIDAIAQAIAANKFVRIGLCGSNNGTWLSANPQPPKPGEPLWAHFLYFGKARLFNGKKQIGAFNSWGNLAGEKGWQWLDEGYVNTILASSAWGRAVWQATTYVFNPNQIPSSFTYNFQKPLNLGDTGTDVKALQTLLQMERLFPASISPTEYFGNVTRQAVLAFQERYEVADEKTLEDLQGKKVGPATLKELNLLAK